MTIATTHRPVHWERLHPLSPVLRGIRHLTAVVVLVGLTSVQRGNGTQVETDVQIALVVLVVLIGIVSWLVTRWTFDGATLRFETGLLRRDARQIPVTRIQAVDVIQPLLARFFGLAELRITVAGGGRGTRLAFLSDERAGSLRAALLAAHHGQDPATPEPADVAAMMVPTDRLLGSVLVSAPMLILVLLVVGVVLIGTEFPNSLPGVAAVLVTYILGIGTVLWRRFNALYGFTVASAADGIRIRRGLLGTVSETIPLRRVQAVRQIEPLLWRALGWCRLEVDLARVPGRNGGTNSGQVRKTLLPVGSLQSAQAIRASVIGSMASEPTRPPSRARLKSPLSYHFLRAGHDDTIAVAVTGRLRQRSCWVPLEKLQSVRRVQGPVQRWLGLATVHVDVAGRAVEAEFRDRDAAETDRLVEELAALSRVARSKELADPRPRARTGGQAPSPVRVVRSAAPGWYADPSGRHRHRYWDGGRWTAHVHDAGQTTIDAP